MRSSSAVERPSHLQRLSDQGGLRSDFSGGLSEHGGLRSDFSGELSEHGGLRSDLTDGMSKHGGLRSDLSDRLNEHCKVLSGLSHSGLHAGRSCELEKQPTCALRAEPQRMHATRAAQQM